MLITPLSLPLSGERNYNMKNFKFIPYNKNLVSRARELRREATQAEKLFWNKVLKNKKFAGFKFTRQKPLDSFILDFYCASLGLAIEIDGKVHIICEKSC